VKACFTLETGFRENTVCAIYSQQEVHSGHVAHDWHSPHVQVVQHTASQHDLASETSAFCGAKLNINKIAEKRMMDFIVKKCFEFRITMLKINTQ
jgi:hypothetical protein